MSAVTIVELAADLHWGVLFHIRRAVPGAEARYERMDFEEQYELCNTDAERVALCRRWLKTYAGFKGGKRWH